jgi:hypothetical protein
MFLQVLRKITKTLSQPGGFLAEDRTWDVQNTKEDAIHWTVMVGGCSFVYLTARSQLHGSQFKE